MKLLFKYLQMNLKGILLLIICSATIGTVLWLYRLPLEAIFYSGMLCLLWILLWFLIGFIKFIKKHQQLQSIKKSVRISIENLPFPQNLLEMDYQEQIKLLYETKCETETAFTKKYLDIADYYTMWAHQIKTPIAAMRLLLQSESGQLSDELQEQLFKIEQYVEMVLHYIRMESAESDLLFKQYALEDIVQQAVHKYAKIFIRKKLRLNFSKLDCTVITDEKWLTFVIEQLLSNALKYTAKGSISIYMDVDRPDCLVIEDTGIGIAPEDIPRIFEKGYTGYNGRADKKSTGIGLYLCKTILSKLAHTIKIESEINKGTKVYVNLEQKKLQTE